MKHRNVMAVIFYSILTLGIYDLFWLVSVKKELNAKTRVHTPTLWLLFAPLLLMLFFVVFFVAASRYDTSSVMANIVVMLLYVVAILAIVPITFFWFFKFSKGVHEYTHGELSTAINFILLYMLRFIGIAIIQDKFNDMLENGAAPVASGATNGYMPQPTQVMPPTIPAQQPLQAPQYPPATQWSTPTSSSSAPQTLVQTGVAEQNQDGQNTPQPPTSPDNPIV